MTDASRQAEFHSTQLRKELRLIDLIGMQMLLIFALLLGMPLIASRAKPFGARRARTSVSAFVHDASGTVKPRAPLGRIILDQRASEVP